jgi:hypothetical protein
MMRFLLGWLRRGLLVLAVLFVALYAGDGAIYKLRGSPQGKVAVNRYIAIPLKGNKQEFDYLGSVDTPCARALFSQAGVAPCWKLSRHPNQGTTIQ